MTSEGSLQELFAMTAMQPTAGECRLDSAALQRRVNELRQIDNHTNWYYLVREYLLIGLTIGATLAFYFHRAEWGMAWAWNIPVTMLAIVLIGALQHRLTTLGHEASHYMFFRNRWLNELVSDWFCMFPMLSNTHHYRIQHLAHHQYVNDCERDPDVTQMQASGHRFQFPMSRRRFVWECVISQLLWLPSLIRYIRIRAKYSATGGGTGPYESKGPRSRLLVLVGICYLLVLAAGLTGLVIIGDPLLLAVLSPCLLASALLFYAVVPARLYRQTLIRPTVSARWTTLGRITYLTAIFTTLAWLTLLTGKPWGLYYVVLWIVPMVTAFSFFMILRQVVQHGNASQDRLTNTRVFHVGSFFRFAVFPLGMDYHLPHHLFPMVPHYRLRPLHQLLMESESYAAQSTLVEGYFFPPRLLPTNPTVLDVMASPRAEQTLV
jgi:fatty acid desaturase